jgi:molecular chaperone GrpE
LAFYGNREKPEKEDAKQGVATEADTSAADTGAASASPGENDMALAEQIQKLLAEKQDLTNTLVRRQADFENYRKRVEKERHHDRHRGVEALVELLLPVLDAFDRALAAYDDPAYAESSKGFELIRKQLGDILAKQGLERIESVGKEFDPHFHHAIESVETAELPDGTVLQELQPGYVFHGRILRPAMVRVTSAPAKTRDAQN